MRSEVAPWLFLLLLIVICGCSSQAAGPDPKYTDLSKKVHEVVVRTQGDPTKTTAGDRQIMADAKSYKIVVPPGY